MKGYLLKELEKNPIIKLKAKNTWLPGYEVTFNFKDNTYVDLSKAGSIPETAWITFMAALATIAEIPEPQLPTRRVKIDCNYELLLCGRELRYTNYTFQINPQLTNLQRELLKLADACGLKVY